MTIRSVQALRETEPSVSLLERLIAAGLISERQLQRALREKSRCDRPLGEILVELGLISDRLLGETLAQLLDDEQIDLGQLLPNPAAIDRVPRTLSERLCVLPIDLDAETELLTLAVSETFDLAAVDELSRVLDSGVSIETRRAAPAEIKSAIRKFYDVALTIPAILKEIDSDETGLLDRAADVKAYGHPVNRLINAIIFAAARRGASAIHVEPQVGFLRVRYRIDGLLSQQLALHQSYTTGIAAGLKATFGSCCEQHSGAGESRMSRMLGTRRTSLTLSLDPNGPGESFIIRIVADDADGVPLEELGFDADALARLRLLMARPDGLIIVAGPAASGKTTTLHSMLRYRSDESVSIVTIADTASCPWPSNRQTDNGVGSGLDEAGRIRSSLRRDSEVLMVGELVEEPAAAMALRAAMAGRQVFTTLQASCALAAVPLLAEIGLERERLAGHISGIVAQRLLRKLCPKCRQPYAPGPLERNLLGVVGSKPLRLYREGTCESCAFLGFNGRVAIFEVLVVDEALDQLIAGSASLWEMRPTACAAGFRELADAAVQQVLSGVTSLSEASRVVDLSAKLR